MGKIDLEQDCEVVCEFGKRPRDRQVSRGEKDVVSEKYQAKVAR